MFSKTLIVSPSGSFYGSEQVLYSHLDYTKKSYTVFVPFGSFFQKKLKRQHKHNVCEFSNIKLLYVKIFLKLLFERYATLYINEGGHIKYAKLIAKLLPFVNVVVHIRLVEDTSSSRTEKLPKNLKLISISNYIQGLLLPEETSIKIVDPLDVTNVSVQRFKLSKEGIKIGIIGRVSLSKGLHNYEKLFNYYFSLPKVKTVQFVFFGDVIDKEKEVSLFFDKYSGLNFSQVEFKGFVEDQEKVFSSIDAVLHLNEKEPLGRIGLESWARGIPFLCFNAGGCAEINETLEMKRFSIAFDTDWEVKVIDLISSLDDFSSSEQDAARLNLQSHFSIERYVKLLENQF
ncbi:glycosyltransferase [Flavobacteriaceae bacterium]|nr:glycosyltransferase [Flavobacteriaceae bacterium]